jgi:hypothetical protein
VDTGIPHGSEQERYRQTAGGPAPGQDRSSESGDGRGVWCCDVGGKRCGDRGGRRSACRLFLACFPFPCSFVVKRAQAQFYQREVEDAQAYFTASEEELDGERTDGGVVMGGRGCGDGCGWGRGCGRGRADGGAAAHRGEALAADGGVVAGGRGGAFGRRWRRGGGRTPDGGVAADVDGPVGAADGRPVARLADKNYGNATGKDGTGWDPRIGEDFFFFYDKIGEDCFPVSPVLPRE